MHTHAHMNTCTCAHIDVMHLRQSLRAVDPGSEGAPNGHGLHLVEPELGWYVPASHGVHGVSPNGSYVPGGQGSVV